MLYIQGSVSNVQKKEADLESRPAVLRKASQRLETHQVGLLSTFYATVVPPTPSELRDTVFFFQTPWIFWILGLRSGSEVDISATENDKKSTKNEKIRNFIFSKMFPIMILDSGGSYHSKICFYISETIFRY